LSELKNLFRRGVITIIVALLVGSVHIMPPAAAQSQNGIVVDHTSVALFEEIPEQYIEAAANMRMLFIDRSVGGNINDGLTCLGYASDEVAPSHCKRYEHVDPAFSVSPSEVDASSGRISRASPIGKAIIGKVQGDVVEVTVPVGKLRYKIIKIGS